MSKRLLAALAFVPTLVAAQNAQKVPVCPSSYPLDGVVLTKTPHDWSGEVYAGFDLESVTVSTEPTHLGELIPTSGPGKGGGSIVLYDGLDSAPKERWLGCVYGYGGVIRLYQRLPSTIKRCQVNYARIKGSKDLSIESYQCK